MNKHLITLITLAALALGLSSTQAASSKVAVDLQQQMNRGEKDLRVIVTLADGLVGTDVEELTNGRGRGLRRNGARGVRGRLHPFEIDALASDPRVRSISPDRRVSGAMDVAVSASGAAAVAQNLGFTGKGITVALIDSGLTPSDAVPARRILLNRDFTERPRRGRDGLGHGTHIAGTIGGSGLNGSVRGVAPDVNFVNLRVLDSEGNGYASSVIESTLR